MSYAPYDKWHLDVISCPAKIKLNEAYDRLLVQRYEARIRGDYELSDKLRAAAEWEYGETIVDSKTESEKGGHHFQYYKRMRAVKWFKKYYDYVRYDGKPIDGLIDAVNNTESLTSQVVGKTVPYYI